MSDLNSNSLPENIRRCMPKEQRAEIGKAAMTQPEADAKFIARKEKALQENIARLLTQRGITFFRQRMDRKTSGTVGWPDFTFAIKGRACAVECKTPEGAITQDQNMIMLALHLDGWWTFVARSEADFLQWLRSVEKETEAKNGLDSTATPPDSSRG
jgi:hypothetical protein